MEVEVKSYLEENRHNLRLMGCIQHRLCLGGYLNVKNASKSDIDRLRHLEISQKLNIPGYDLILKGIPVMNEHAYKEFEEYFTATKIRETALAFSAAVELFRDTEKDLLEHAKAVAKKEKKYRKNNIPSNNLEIKRLLRIKLILASQVEAFPAEARYVLTDEIERVESVVKDLKEINRHKPIVSPLSKKWIEFKNDLELSLNFWEGLRDLIDKTRKENL